MSNVRDSLNNLDGSPQPIANISKLPYITYIRPVTLDDNTEAYGVYSEEGIQLAVFASEEAAYFSARQSNLNPLRVH